MSGFKKGLFYSPDVGGAEGAAGGEGDQEQGDQENEEMGWDAFHSALPEAAQKLIADREVGLRSALKTERDARGDAEKNLREAAAELKEGSDAQKKLLELADTEAAASQKAEFYEEAHEADVKNLKLAYIVAVQDGLISKTGKIDFKTMKESYPELFAKKFVADGGAGAGTGTKQPGGNVSMNDIIRKKAGRQN